MTTTRRVNTDVRPDGSIASEPVPDDRDALLRGILADPLNPTTRAAYADYLAERCGVEFRDAQREAALLAIRAAPDEDGPRLDYAALLESWEASEECASCVGKHGHIVPRNATHRTAANAMSRQEFDSERREFSAHWEKCKTCSGTGRVSNGMAARAEFVRVQCELAALTGGWTPSQLASIDMYLDPQDADEQAWKHEFQSLQARSQDLWTRIELPGWVVQYSIAADWQRGFLWSVRCSWPDWLAHHAAILAYPDVVLRRVELTTPVPTMDWGRTTATKARGEGPNWINIIGNNTQVVWLWDSEMPESVAASGRNFSPELFRVACHKLFPGHCRYIADGAERWHPIEWVLPE